MQYRMDNKSGRQLSILGFGCMRFPNNLGQIDMKKSEALVMEAIKNGVNYFDTAYIYGGSEVALGQILHKNNVRKDVCIATKLPLMKCHHYDDFDKLFYSQLEKLQTDYIDYYLMHNLSDTELWAKLCGLGIEKWIADKKKSGAIQQLGFSFHGSHNEFDKLLKSYDWDFCQIQYNYVNINYQAGAAGLKKAADLGLPVIIMEPLLGGKLAVGLPKKAVELFAQIDNNLSPAAWALKWLWNQPQVTVVLSGMNHMDQLHDNINAANNALPNMLDSQQVAVFDAVTREFEANYKIPCTGCNYCMPCPKGINIPGCFTAYNASYAAGMFTGLQQYILNTGGFNRSKDISPSACVKCGNCEKHCPQRIEIASLLPKVKKRMEPLWIKPILALIGKFR